ncbi:cyclic nucleotide-binding-like protein [Cladochytrium replicatum]|nr:cyclic nucleotide-binding-like protein [Cladochytrium replicatum]
MSERFSSDPSTVQSVFPEILKDLNREVLRAQPQDIYQFCANYFNQKLAEERSKLLVLADGHQHTGGSMVKGNDSSVMRTMEEDEEAKKLSGGAEDESDTYTDDDDDEDEEEEEAAPPPPPPTYNRGRRTSVSAESMAPTLDTNYVKKVVDKSDEQRQRIRQSIINNFLFRSLDEEQYADVVNAMEEKKVAAGEEVIQQGSMDCDYFYVVETGTLDVFVSRNGQPPVKVTDYGPGGSFGELALMYNAPRAATVVCTSTAVLWALDRVTFRRILMENTSRKRRMYEEFLEEVPLLVSLEPYERHKIADALESVTFSDGDTVIRQGDRGDNFFIIESGEARVTQMDENGVEHESPITLKKGQYFGELALITNEPRRATIIAKGRLKCASLGKRAFERLFGPVLDIVKRNATNYEKIAEQVLPKA